VQVPILAFVLDGFSTIKQLIIIISNATLLLSGYIIHIFSYYARITSGLPSLALSSAGDSPMQREEKQ
jgi:hypothetical protein